MPQPLTPKKLKWSAVLWRSTTPSRTITHTRKKDVLFIVEGWNAKLESQDIPGIIGSLALNRKWFRAKANRVLSKDHAGKSKHLFSTTRGDSTHGHYPMVNTKSDWLCSLKSKVEKFYTVNKNKTWSWLWLRSWAPFLQNSGLNWRN